MKNNFKNCILISYSVLLLYSCSNTKKHKSLEISKKDSSAFVAKNITENKLQNSNEEIKTNAESKNVVNVEFVPDSSNDDTLIKVPITISIGGGKFEINPGNRKVKSVTANIENTKDSTAKKETTAAEHKEDKSKQETNLHTENKATEVDKYSRKVKIFSFIALSGALIGTILFIRKKKKQIDSFTKEY